MEAVYFLGAFLGAEYKSHMLTLSINAGCKSCFDSGPGTNEIKYLQMASNFGGHFVFRKNN